MSNLIFCDGFDHYQAPLMKWDGQTLAATGSGAKAYISPSLGRGGSGALVCPVVSGSGAGVQDLRNLVFKNYSNAATIYFGFALYWTPGSQSIDMPIVSLWDGSTAQVDLRLTATGTFYFTRNGTSVGSTASSPMPSSAYHYVECKITIDPAAGGVLLKIDGATVINSTGLNTRNSSNSYAGQIRLGPGSVAQIGTNTYALCYFDDFYIHATQNLGDVKVDGKLPTGNSATLQYAMQAAAWAASTVMGVGQSILDSNGNLQRVTSVTGDAKTGTPTHPTWATGVGATTTDNHVTWTCLGAQSQYLQVNQNPPEGVAAIVRNTAYTVGQMGWDTNNNLQLCTTAGTTGNNEPTYATIVGNTTSDGGSFGVTWTLLGSGEDLYLNDSTVSDSSRFTFPAFVGSQVFAVVDWMRARKDDAGTRSIRGLCKSGSTVGDNGADLALAATYAYMMAIFETDPATGVAWTVSGVNAAEFGIKTTA